MKAEAKQELYKLDLKVIREATDFLRSLNAGTPALRAEIADFCNVLEMQGVITTENLSALTDPSPPVYPWHSNLEHFETDGIRAMGGHLQ